MREDAASKGTFFAFSSCNSPPGTSCSNKGPDDGCCCINVRASGGLMKSVYPALGCDAILINGREVSSALVSLPVKTFNYYLAQPYPISLYIFNAYMVKNQKNMLS